jgi:two-component system cell cycle sensor histidine kinase PleC
MHETLLPRRARISARTVPATSGATTAFDWTQAVRASARNAGLPDPMAELFSHQQKDLKQALERAEFAERIKSNFLAHMSHEFRTPLNAIIGFSTLIRSGACEDPERIREYAAAIECAGQQLCTMLSGILELAALDAEQISLAEDAIDLATMLGCSIESVMSQASAAEIAVSADIPADLPQLRGDRRRIRQVFDQILSNAVKFTPAKGKVRITVTLGADLVIAIADTGIGMAVGDLDRALAAFERVDGLLAREHGGAGIGLPLATRLVQLHGGQLSVESAPGIGTKVSIALPLDRLIADSEAF